MRLRHGVLRAAVGASMMSTLVGGGIAWTIPASAGTPSGVCYDHRSGQVRFYDRSAGATCRNTETPLRWRTGPTFGTGATSGSRPQGPLAVSRGYRRFCTGYAGWKNGDPSTRDLRTVAPPEIADAVDVFVTSINQSGQAASEDPAFWSALAEINQVVLDNCGYRRVVDVTMAEYRFDGIPAQLTRGFVAFNLRNEGAELHNLQFLRYRGDATAEKVRLAYFAGQSLDKLIEQFPGGGFAFPRQSDIALVEFRRPGRYVAFCNITVGSTPEATAAANQRVGSSADETEQADPAPFHWEQGMAVDFSVE
jgi:hypothetical protein